MSDASDELRIIARDGGSLTLADRAAIANAASEMEQMLHAVGQAYRELIEVNAHRLALSEQLRDVRRKLPPVPAEELPWKMESGWLACGWT